ncbi:MAG: hypothetical protein ACK5MA_08630 [Parachlamydiaceae bacterium]
MLCSVLVAVMCLSTGFCKNKVFLYEEFYQNQSYEMFAASMREAAVELLFEPNPKGFSWGTPAAAKADFIKCGWKSLASLVGKFSLYEALILRDHPEYIAPYQATYPEMGLYERAVFLRAMRSLGRPLGPEITIDSEKLYDLVADPQLRHISWIDDYILQEDSDIDLMRYCFLATGDEKYVVKAVEYLQKKTMDGRGFSKKFYFEFSIFPDLKAKMKSLILSDLKYQDLCEELFPSQ